MMSSWIKLLKDNKSFKFKIKFLIEFSYENSLFNCINNYNLLKFIKLNLTNILQTILNKNNKICKHILLKSKEPIALDHSISRIAVDF